VSGSEKGTHFMDMPSIKKLGFGLMRLPRSGGEIDLAQVTEMVDRYMAAGFTYFDTAWAYPGSEDAIRQALVERYPRESFQLATKNAAWLGCKTREEAVAQFETSLRQTGAGYFDFYLLHNLGSTALTISTTSISGISSRRKSVRA
jgi:predicted aldo/keto reductase-like oxidoreductase